MPFLDADDPIIGSVGGQVPRPEQEDEYEIWASDAGNRALYLSERETYLYAYRGRDFAMFDWGIWGLIKNGTFSYDAAVRKAMQWVQSPEVGPVPRVTRARQIARALQGSVR